MKPKEIDRHIMYGYRRKKINPDIPDILHKYHSEADKPKTQSECGYYQIERCMGRRCSLWCRKTEKCSLLAK